MKRLLALLFCAVGLAQPTRVTLDYDDLASLLATTVQTWQTNLVASIAFRSTPGDGGGGEFYFAPGDTTATNLGTVFASTGVDGRWIRNSDGNVSVKWFGAVGNGTTDDTDAFKNVIAGYTPGSVVRTSGNDYVIWLPTGSYIISDTLVFTNGATMIGESTTRSQILFTGANKPCLKVQNSTPGTAEYRFENFTLYRWAADGVPGTDEVAIQFKDCTATYRPVIKNVNIRRRQAGMEWYHGISFDTSTLGPQSGIVESVLVQNARGHSFASFDKMNAMSFISCYSSTPDLDGFHFESSPNYTSMYNCANDTPGRYGYYFEDSTIVGLVGCGVENAGTSGIYATNSYGLHFSNCHVEQTIAATSHNIQLLECNLALLNSIKTTKTGGTDGDYAIYIEDADGYYKPQVINLMADSNVFTNGLFNVDVSNISGRNPPTDGGVLTYESANQRAVWKPTSSQEKPTFWMDSVWFDGTDTAKARTQPGWAIGTNDFTLWCRFRTAGVLASGVHGLVAIGDDDVEGLAAGGCAMYTGNDDIYVSVQGAAVTDYIRVKATDILTTYTNDTISVVFTRNGPTVALYVNGSPVATTEETSGTPPDWEDTVDATYLTASLRTTLTPFLGEIVEWGLINKDLTDGEASRLHFQGPTRELAYGSESELSSGLLTIGYTYRITANTDADFTTVGAADSNVGTEFIATGIGTGLLDAGDKVVRVGQVSHCIVDGGRLRDVVLNTLPFGTNTVTTRRQTDAITPRWRTAVVAGGSMPTAFAGDICKSNVTFYIYDGSSWNPLN